MLDSKALLLTHPSWIPVLVVEGQLPGIVADDQGLS